MIKELNHHEDIAVLNASALNNKTSKHTEEWTYTNKEVHKFGWECPQYFREQGDRKSVEI